jgi:hypothetical protein
MTQRLNYNVIRPEPRSGAEPGFLADEIPDSSLRDLPG